MPSIEHALNSQDKDFLLQLAARAIRHGVETGKPLAVSLDGLSPALCAIRASFVTLNKFGQLRGCIGSLQANRPLALDIAANAYAAAFRDPRFPAVEENELADLDIHLSLLTVPQPMTFASEEDLLSKISPGVDGLILEDGRHRGTFLPSVWEQLPEVREFWRHLKHKAGLPLDYWSDTLTVQRYRTEVIP
jgi:AmmeMemoRadiSam system protein A